MRAYSSVPPTFWTTIGRRLRKKPKPLLLALYVQTCPSANMAGLYYLPLPTIAHETGLAPEEVRTAFAVLADEGFAEYDEDEEVVWIPDMARAQVGDTLKADDKRIKALVRLVEEVSPNRFVQEFAEKYRVPFNLPETGPWDFDDPPSEPLRRAIKAPSEPLRRGILQGQGQGQGQGPGQDPPFRAAPPRTLKKKTGAPTTGAPKTGAPSEPEVSTKGSDSPGVEPRLGSSSDASGSPASMRGTGRPEPGAPEPSPGGSDSPPVPAAPSRPLTVAEIREKYLPAGPGSSGRA